MSPISSTPSSTPSTTSCTTHHTAGCDRARPTLRCGLTPHYHTRPRCAAPPSARVLRVAAMFGLDADAPDLPPDLTSSTPPSTPGALTTPAPGISLPLPGITLITGPSGSGKSSLLRGMIRSRQPPCRMVRLDRLSPPPDRPIVDGLPATLSLEASLELLSRAGLAEARLLLRRPRQLSDGQRMRFDLARGIALLVHSPRRIRRPRLLVADEFTAPLDRITAHHLALHLRHWCDRLHHDGAPPVALLLATAHDDLIAPLDPDLHIHINIAGRITLHPRDAAPTPASTPGPTTTPTPAPTTTPNTTPTPTAGGPS